MSLDTTPGDTPADTPRSIGQGHDASAAGGDDDVLSKSDGAEAKVEVQVDNENEGSASLENENDTGLDLPPPALLISRTDRLPVVESGGPDSVGSPVESQSTAASPPVSPERSDIANSKSRAGPKNSPSKAEIARKHRYVRR